ncbi:MAG TPA: RagB/SusD family nutrient uptake outer membrane protein [Chitinophagaceae bacterium]|nr:RagB/SusD family nutrient uptake outer membrane protein [Chitinophagaceae bacterium]
MNTIKIYSRKILIASLSASLLFGSCKKTLEVLPNSSFTDATAFTTPARVELAINGVYDAAQSGFYAGGAVRGYPFGAANIEQGDMRGEDMLNNALFYQITYESTYNPTSANQDFMFQTLYALINRANLTIDGVNDAVSKNIITSAAGISYVAECRFLRAMAHHELLINYARPFRDGNGDKMGIIYRDFGVSTEATIAQARAQKRTTVADNYAKLLADLDYAETNLPATTTGANKTYRATKAAAIALKMRVRLHMGDWAGVITEGNKLVPASAPYTSPIGGWTLMAAPNGPFTTAGWQGTESIFSIRNSATDNGGVNGALPNMLGPAAVTAPASGGGRALVRISPIIYNHPAFRCDDLRRNMMVTTGTGASINYLSVKYIDAVTSTDPAPQIRYAEVLLTLAEAEARQGTGVNSRALELLNAVRNRAVTNVANQYTAGSFADKKAFIQAILDERRIEFIAEGKRWGDIHRNAVDPDFSTGGIPAKVGTGTPPTTAYNCTAGSSVYTTPVGAIPYADYRFIWPIPNSERQVNPNFEQNPSY